MATTLMTTKMLLMVGETGDADGDELEPYLLSLLADQLLQVIRVLINEALN